MKYFLKLTFLLALTFIFGGATLVTMYATGNQVVEKNQNMYMVSHTEYRYGEQGQIVVRLVDFSGGAVSVNNCTATILYPDKTYFVNGALMNTTGAITGDHYYTFTTPNGPEGIYEYQATCIYAAGAKSKSATNSFHLSSAFNTLFSQVSEINSTITAFKSEVQNNFSQVLTKLDNLTVSVNLTEVLNAISEVNSTVNSINSSLVAFTAETYLRLDEINATTQSTALAVGTIQSDLTALNASMYSQFNSLSAQLNSNTTTILDKIEASRLELISINATLTSQLTTINDNVLAINTSIMNELSAVNFSISSDIANFRQEVQYNFTDVLAKLDNLNASSIDYSAILTQINQTTVDTYSYLTGTMATNINSILSQLGIINATVARIEANTLEINTTVTNISATANQILQNQQDEVFMDVYSG